MTTEELLEDVYSQPDFEPSYFLDKNYIKVYNIVAKATSINWNEKAVLCFILSYITDGKECFATNKHIGEALGISERTARRSIQSLKENHMLKAWYQISDTGKVIKRILHIRKIDVLTELTRVEGTYYWTEELPKRIKNDESI